MRNSIVDSKVIKGDKEDKVQTEDAKILHPRRTRNQVEIEKEEKEFKKYLKELLSDKYSYGSKLDNILRMNSIIIPQLLWELNSECPDVERSLIASRAISAIKENSIILMKRRESELSDEIDPNSPKFQLIFGWFIELINEILIRQGLDTMLINSVFNELSLELSGWEDKILKRLKGLSSKALDEVKNPFVKELKKGKGI